MTIRADTVVLPKRKDGASSSSERRVIVVGLGSSVPQGAHVVTRAFGALDNPPHARVVGKSPLFETRAFGGATIASFTNAVALVETPMHPLAFLSWLHSIERRFGRVRGIRNASRTLDLDVLFVVDQPGGFRGAVEIPHPGAFTRASAVIPAVAAFDDAGRAVPAVLRAAARAHAATKLTVVVVESTPP